MSYFAATAPRALFRRPPGIQVELSPYEFHLLIEALERRACAAAEVPEQIDYADYLFRRIAELREAGR